MPNDFEYDVAFSFLAPDESVATELNDALSGRLDARKGLAADHALITQMRDVVSRIAELVDLFARADALLAQILPSTLTSGELGLHSNETKSGDE